MREEEEGDRHNWIFLGDDSSGYDKISEGNELRLLTVVISGAEASARVPKNVQIQLCQFGGRQKYDKLVRE